MKPFPRNIEDAVKMAIAFENLDDLERVLEKALNWFNKNGDCCCDETKWDVVALDLHNALAKLELDRKRFHVTKRTK
jgi:ubiquinone/menaquinone biosynthesis C-methylase UbiE